MTDEASYSDNAITFKINASSRKAFSGVPESNEEFLHLIAFLQLGCPYVTADVYSITSGNQFACKDRLLRRPFLRITDNGPLFKLRRQALLVILISYLFRRRVSNDITCMPVADLLLIFKDYIYPVRAWKRNFVHRLIYEHQPLIVSLIQIFLDCYVLAFC